MKLNPVITRDDYARAARAIIAWREGDKDTFELVLAEASAITGGVAALIFALTDFASDLVGQIPGGGTETLRQSLLSLLDSNQSPPEDRS